MAAKGSESHKEGQASDPSTLGGVTPPLTAQQHSQESDASFRDNDADLESGSSQTATESSALLGGEAYYGSVPGVADPVTTEQKKARDWDTLPALGDSSWRRESKMILTSSIPLIITWSLQYSINATSVFAVGKIGKQELGAVALANMTAAMTCLAPFQGLATCLDTLCAQAYGEGRKHLVGLQVQRNVLFLCSAAIPIAVLWMFSEPILVRMVDAETARLSASYLKVMIFSIPAFAIFESGKRMLQAQGLFRETSYIILVVAPINIVLNWFLVWKMELGFIGAPIGVVISRNLLAILMVLYIKFINGYQCWGGLDRRAFSNWGIMVRLALPGMTMVVAEWLAFELMTLLSSRFGTDYLAGQSAIMTLVALLYQIPFSMSVAGSTRVASLVGGGVIDSAKLAAEISTIASFLISILNVVLCIALRWRIPLLFTEDEGVIAVIAKTLPVVAIAVFWDGVSAGAHGILRGIGKQSIGGPVNLLSHYVIALPVSLTLAFYYGWEIKGLWTGITTGLFAVSVIEYFYILRVDWENVAEEARVRNASG